MALGIYAGSTVANMSVLPSPTTVTPTFEIIWSENTGRAQTTEGGTTTKGKMIGDVVAEKATYAIKWGVISDADMTTIKSKLTKGFFYFGIGTSLLSAKASATKFYRSEIAGDYLPIGDTIYWKDVTVSVIEQ